MTIVTDDNKVAIQVLIWQALEQAGYTPNRNAVVTIREAIAPDLLAKGVRMGLDKFKANAGSAGAAVQSADPWDTGYRCALGDMIEDIEKLDVNQIVKDAI